MELQDFAQLGTLGFIFYLAIKEFFGWLKTRNGNGQSDKPDGQDLLLQKILAELRLQNSNHLTHVQLELEKGYSKLNDTVRNGNERIVDKLSEISGKLSK